MLSLHEGYVVSSRINDQRRTNFFRLAAALCFAFVIMPVHIEKQREIPLDEHGIGGGILYEEAISEEEDGVLLMIPASVETTIVEPESLLKNRALLFDSYTLQYGDIIGNLAISFGLNEDTITSVNKITNTRTVQAGRALRIPNQDGILYRVRNGDTLSSLAEKYKVEVEAIQTANELFSENIVAGKDLFIPGARLDWVTRQEINGDLFIWPVNGAITSAYGYRIDPFNRGRRQFHSGLDIRGGYGTPIRAAMSGRVSQVGYDHILGNYVAISHHSGYRTLYAHMSVIRTRTGAYVATGERIGDVGSTGLSTGPHLHFMVYKNGVTVNPRSLMR
jgi:murein DD-endopeptidase MepM/ murein hydrolase activator NlpD